MASMKAGKNRKHIVCTVLFLFVCLCVFSACKPRTTDVYYTVRFDTCGGSALDSVRLPKGSSLDLPTPPTKDGFVFYDWYYDSEYHTRFNASMYHAENDLTLYARWIDAMIYRHPIHILEIPHGRVSVEGGYTFSYAGTEIRLIVSPDPGYRLKADTLRYNENVIENYSFIMPPETVTISAEFEPAPYQVYAQNMEHAFLRTERSTYTMGETVRFDVIPDVGYFITKIFLNKLPYSETTNEFIMPANNVLIEAEVQAIDYSKRYAITVEECAGGNVRTVASASEGEWVQLFAEPQEGYTLESFTLNGEPLAGAAFRMPKDRAEVGATFVATGGLRAYWIRVEETEGGKIECASSASIGRNVSFDVFPQEGYEFCGILLNGSFVPATESFRMLASNVTLTPVFRPAPHYITVECGSGGKVEVLEAAYAGTYLSFEITPNEGYRVKPNGVRLDGRILSEKAFVMPNKDVTLTVEFLSTLPTEETHNVYVVQTEGGELLLERDWAKTGEWVRVEISPHESYRYVPFSACYYSDSDNDTFESGFYMPDEDVYVYAHFERIYRITTIQGENCGILSDREVAAEGERVNFLAYAKNSGDGNAIIVYLNQQQITGTSFIMPAENVVLAASTDRTNRTQVYTLTETSTEGGKLIIPAQTYFGGDLVSVQVESALGYRFVRSEISFDGVEWGESELSFYMPARNVWIRGIFEAAEESERNLDKLRVLHQTLQKCGIDAELIDAPKTLIRALEAMGHTDGAAHTQAVLSVEGKNDWVAILFSDYDKIAYRASVISDYYRNEWGSAYPSLYSDGLLIISRYDLPNEYADLIANGLTKYGNGYYYRRTSGGWGLYRYIAESETVLLPLSLEGAPLERILPFAFAGSEHVRRVDLGGASILANYSLADMENLETVYLENICELSALSFLGSDRLRELILPVGYSAYRLENEVLYDTNYTRAVLSIKDRSNPDLILHQNCKSIDPWAFSGSNLQSISFCATEKIGAFAFYGCSSLQTITEQGFTMVKTIEREAFQGTRITYWLLGELLNIEEDGLFFPDGTTVEIMKSGITPSISANGTRAFLSEGELRILFHSVGTMNAFARGIFGQYSDNFDLAEEDISDHYGVIQFRTGGGTYIDARNELINTNFQIAAIPTPQKDGYRFDGWYFDEFYQNEVPSSFLFSKRHYVIYAKWAQ